MVELEAVSTRSASAQKGEGESLHSGRSMMPAMPSRMAGRSVPDIDWLFRPATSSNSPVHHPLRMLTRRSTSSGRNRWFEGCAAYVRKNGSRVVRRTLAFSAMDLDWNLCQVSLWLFESSLWSSLLSQIRIERPEHSPELVFLPWLRLDALEVLVRNVARQWWHSGRAERSWLVRVERQLLC